MKRFMKRGLALMLAAALTLTPMANASEALGSELKDRTVTVADGVSVTRQSLWSATYSDLRTEHFITYIPGEEVIPAVSYGPYVSSTATLTSMAAALEQQGMRVVGGINGGFFNSNGTPIGLVLSEGKLQCAANGANNYYAVAFRADGSAFIGKPVLTMTATWGTAANLTVDEEGNEIYIPAQEYVAQMAGLNKVREDGGYYLYTDTFAPTTKNTVAGVDVVLCPLDQSAPDTGELIPAQSWLTIGGTVECQVEAVRSSTADQTIPAGRFVLSMNANSPADKLALLSNLKLGDRVTLSVTAEDEMWNEAVSAVSGLYSLLEEGQVAEGLSTARNPYTAVGLKEDGSVVLYTIDGRRAGYSVGATYTQVAERLLELGCVTAIALDGGGSTSVGTTYADQAGFAMINRSSDNSPRKVSSCLFLVTDVGASGELQEFYLNSANDLLLPGAELPLTVTGVDTNYYPMEYDGNLHWQAQRGEVTQNEEGGWVYTADPETEENYWDTITVSGQGSSGEMKVKVLARLSKLTVRNEATGKTVSKLELEPEEVVDLTAAAGYCNMAVQGTDVNFSWTADEAVGTIDETGRFTAGAVDGEGKITVTAADKTVTIPVTVASIDPFVDIQGHWGHDYAVYLHELGITNGVVEADGKTYFYPNRSITRGELLTLVVRMLGEDPALHADVELPFADLDKIDKNWLLPYVKTAYDLGIFTGAQRGGALYADTGTAVTRETAMTIIGRTLGYTKTADLSAYTDCGKVSDWAETYVQTLVSLGVIQGSNGMLSPGANVTRAEIAKIIGVVVDLPPYVPEEPEVPEVPAEPELPEEPVDPEDPENPEEPAEEQPDNQVTFDMAAVAMVRLRDIHSGAALDITQGGTLQTIVSAFQGASYQRTETAAGSERGYQLQFFDAEGGLLEDVLVLSTGVLERDGFCWSWTDGPQPDLYYLGSLLINQM